MSEYHRAIKAAAEAAFRARLAELGVVLLEPYRGSRVPHRAVCAAGHPCSPRPCVIARGDGPCWTCAKRNNPGPRGRAQAAEATFLARLAELGATLLEPYHGSGAPHRAICAAGHNCSPRPDSVKQGQGICRVCAGLDPATAEAAFRTRLAELGAVLLEPRWLGTHRRHRIRCAAGHEYAPHPSAVRQGQGICMICAGKDPARAEAAFRARLKELGATLLEPTWLGAHTPHQVRCPGGHESVTYPANAQQGRGVCRACSGRVWDVFYVVTTRPGNRLKFGITSGDSRARLAAHRTAGYSVTARLMTGLPGNAAAEIEIAARAALRLARIKPIRGREYFDGSALAVVLDVADNYPISRDIAA